MMILPSDWRSSVLAALEAFASSSASRDLACNSQRRALTAAAVSCWPRASHRPSMNDDRENVLRRTQHVVRR
ncbi:hypothetical protein BDW22DRAFT_647717 [Trametopsis cervina]|nr:hypothetical protein BDW22DRAFT_647717 [Trametopsis cervina]